MLMRVSQLGQSVETKGNSLTRDVHGKGEGGREVQTRTRNDGNATYLFVIFLIITCISSH